MLGFRRGCRFNERIGYGWWEEEREREKKVELFFFNRNFVSRLLDLEFVRNGNYLSFWKQSWNIVIDKLYKRGN